MAFVFCEPEPFLHRCAHRHCRPASGCCPLPFFLLLGIVLSFPCLLRMVFTVLFLRMVFGVVASCVGEVVGEESHESAQSAEKKAKPFCKQFCKPTGCKPSAESSAPPDHSSVSVTADEASLTIAVSAPGVASENLDVKLQPGDPPVLTIKGESTVSGIRRGVNRTIMLPKEVDVDEARASHVDGLLTLTVPKKVAPPKQIKIESGVAQPARCCPVRKSALLAEIREQAVALKKTQGPPPRDEPPRAADAVDAPAPSRVEGGPAEQPTTSATPESDDEAGQWELVKELSESVDAAILQELDDMGFTDRATNAALLAKHDGSVKATVKELVALRRAAVKSDKATQIEEAAG